MDITILCRNVAVSGVGSRKVTVDIDGFYAGDMISMFTPEQIVKHSDKDDLLSVIGSDYCREYFGLKDED